MIRNIDMIARWVVRLQDYEGHAPVRLSQEDRRTLTKVLDDIASLPQMSPAIAKEHLLVERLKLIMGTSDNTKIKHSYKFPAPFPAIAREIYDKFQAMNWGAIEEIGPRLPSRDHPIFGDQGLMRGICVKENSQRRTFFIRTDFLKRDSAVLGDNGLAVGGWWPYQICALRDGAHGSLMAGISGTQNTFAYSIVISGKYSSLDIDEGDTIHYSDSGALQNKDPKKPIASGSTGAMRRSARFNQPIRVLRSSPGDRAKSKGLRYDGLYSIAGSEIKHNELGGAYLCFRLVREPGQPPIDQSRPTEQDLDSYKQIERGY